MTNEPEPRRDANQPLIYHIRLRGHLGQQWTDWFEGMTITLEEDDHTLLTGLVSDQAALHGLLKKVRDLGLPLLSVDSKAPVADEIKVRARRNESAKKTGVDDD